MKKFLILAVLTLATSMIAQQANASVLVRVSQESTIGAGDFDNKILGFIDPFGTTKTAKDFYQYNIPTADSFNGPAPTLVADQSHLFLVDADDGLSLFVVHDKPRQGIRGIGGSAKMRFDLSGDTANLKLVDDRGEAESLNGGTTFTSNHAWDRLRTDGLVIGSLDNAWKMLVQFTTAPTGLTSWLAYSSWGSPISLDIETGRRVRLDFAPSPPTSIPEPSSTLGLLAFSTLGVSFLLKRKQQQKVFNPVGS